MRSRSRTRALVLTAVAAGTLSCTGTSDGGNPTGPTGPPVVTNTIMITGSGVSPKNVVIAVGTRVLFVNNDNRSHNMSSDDHPDHTDCPEINQVGLLAPGQSRETGNLVQVRTCSFHDHDNPSSASLQGSIVIQ